MVYARCDLYDCDSRILLFASEEKSEATKYVEPQEHHQAPEAVQKRRALVAQVRIDQGRPGGLHALLPRIFQVLLVSVRV